MVEELKARYGLYSPLKGQGIVDISRIGNIVYIAYRIDSPYDKVKTKISCLAVRRKGDKFDAQWDELNPTWAKKCPKKILKLLTESEYPQAKNWRNSQKFR